MSKNPRLSAFLTSAACLLVATATALICRTSRRGVSLSRRPMDCPAGRFRRPGALPLVRKEFSLDAQPVRVTLRIVGLGDFDALRQRPAARRHGHEPALVAVREDDLLPGVRHLGLVHPGAQLRGRDARQFVLEQSQSAPGPLQQARPAAKGRRAVPALRRSHSGAQRRQRRAASARDDTWRPADGPVVFSHVYAGEDFDARRQQPGWDRAGFDDRAWQPARVVPRPARQAGATGLAGHQGSAAVCAGVGEATGAGRLPL